MASFVAGDFLLNKKNTSKEHHVNYYLNDDWRFSVLHYYVNQETLLCSLLLPSHSQIHTNILYNTQSEMRPQIFLLTNKYLCIYLQTWTVCVTNCICTYNVNLCVCVIFCKIYTIVAQCMFLLWSQSFTKNYISCRVFTYIGILPRCIECFMNVRCN